MVIRDTWPPNDNQTVSARLHVPGARCVDRVCRFHLLIRPVSISDLDTCNPHCYLKFPPIMSLLVYLFLPYLLISSKIPDFSLIKPCYPTAFLELAPGPYRLSSI